MLSCPVFHRRVFLLLRPHLKYKLYLRLCFCPSIALALGGSVASPELQHLFDWDYQNAEGSFHMWSTNDENAT